MHRWFLVLLGILVAPTIARGADDAAASAAETYDAVIRLDFAPDAQALWDQRACAELADERCGCHQGTPQISLIAWRHDLGREGWCERIFDASGSWQRVTTRFYNHLLTVPENSFGTYRVRVTYADRDRCEQIDNTFDVLAGDDPAFLADLRRASEAFDLAFFDRRSFTRYHGQAVPLPVPEALAAELVDPTATACQATAEQATAPAPGSERPANLERLRQLSPFLTQPAP